MIFDFLHVFAFFLFCWARHPQTPAAEAENPEFFAGGSAQKLFCAEPTRHLPVTSDVFLRGDWALLRSKVDVSSTKVDDFWCIKKV